MAHPDIDIEAGRPAESAQERAVRGSTSLRSLGAILLVAGVLTVAQAFGFGAFVMLAFGSAMGLAWLSVVVALTCAAVALALKVTTGRAHVVAAIVVTFTAAMLLAAAIARVGRSPLLWVAPGFDLAYLLIGLGSALVLGLFLGPLWLRLVAGAWVVLIVVLVANGSTAEDAAEQTPIDSVDQAQRDANFESFLESGVHPLVADLPGSTVARAMADGATAQTWIVTESGGAIQIDVGAAEPGMSEGYPCWRLAPLNSTLETTGTLEDYADFCVRNAAGWARPDGTGVVNVEGDRMISVIGAYDAALRVEGATRSANAEEVAAAVALLRPMNEHELRDAVGDAWLSGTF